MSNTENWPLSTRPRLRDDLRVEDVSRDNFVARVVDERFSRRIQLDRTALAVLRLIDGERDLGSILLSLKRQGFHMPTSLLRKVLLFFQRHHLFEDSPLEPEASDSGKAEELETSRIVLRSDKEEGVGAPRVYFLEEARHDCQGCGMCCRGYQLGPLTEEEAARIRAETFREDGERLNRAPKVEEKESKGKKYRILELVADGSCVFLSRDQKCILHREKGEDAKPWFCRAFPNQFVMAPDGRVFAYLQMECFGYHEARKKGRPFREKVDALRRVLSVTRDIPLLPNKVQIGESRAFSLEEYYAVEQWMLERIRTEPGGPSTALQALGHFIRHLEGGGSVEDFVSRESSTDPLADDRMVFEVVRFARGGIADLKPSYLAGQPEGTSAGMRRFFLDALELFSGEGDPAEHIPLEDVEGFEKNTECVELLREFLRNEVFSKEWYRCRDLRAGWALTVVRYLLGVAGSRLLAHRWRQKRVTAKALVHSLTMVARNLRRGRVEKLLEEDRSPLIRIYSASVGDSSAGGGNRGGIQS
jgi:Fe-S-cluster containining protein